MQFVKLVGLLHIFTVIIVVLLLMSITHVAAAQEIEQTIIDSICVKFLAMVASVGVCAIASAYAVTKVSVAAFSCAAERPEILGRAIVFAGLAEGIAIYGLLIAFLMWIT